ncbi:MAG: hypothetical protein GX633_06695 [Clostridiales bacterium]|nr:hypothetical protein [Clostridiales bacterium]
MKFESAKHPAMIAIMAVFVLLFISSAIVSCFTFGVVGAIILIALNLTFIAVFVWIYFTTYYELREDELYVHSGPFREHIAYNTIVNTKKTKGYSFMCTLAFNRIEIRRKVNGTILSSFVSPVNEDEFLAELEKRYMTNG